MCMFFHIQKPSQIVPDLQGAGGERGDAGVFLDLCKKGLTANGLMK